MIASLPRAAPRRAFLAMPIHTMAGVHAPRMGGLLDFLGGGVGSVIGSLFGGSSEERQLKAQRKIVADQLNAATAMAKIQADLGAKQVDAALATERIRAANELAALDAAYSASLSSQRNQKAIAQEQLSAQLADASQSGVYSLAKSGMEQTASVSRAYPTMATLTFVAIAGVSVWAIARMRTGAPPPRRRRRRSKNGKVERSTFSGPASPWAPTSTPSYA